MNTINDSTLRDKSRLTKVDNVDIKYLCFIKPSLAFKIPIVIIDDGFYDFEMMENLISSLKESFPIYFVTIPYVGADHEMLTALDQINLLKGFCDNIGVDRINLLGISFSAILAHNFAYTFPECIDKLILQGITSTLKDSTKMMLQENINFLEEGKFEKFAACFSMNIMNFPRNNMINKGREAHNHFYNKYKDIDQRKADNIKEHLKRILSENILVGRTSCSTLVLAGQYDHFTTPYENFLVSKKCLNSTLGILKRVDHFANIEKNKMMSKIYSSFFSNEEMSNFSGVDFYTDEFYPNTRRQIEPRYRWGERVSAKLSDDNLFKQKIEVNIIDLNAQGCKIQIDKGYTIDELRELEIEVFPNCKMNLLVFKKNENNTYHGIFNHRCVEQTYDFLNIYEDNICNKKSFKAA